MEKRSRTTMRCVFSVLSLTAFFQLLCAGALELSDQSMDFPSLERIEPSLPLHCCSDTRDLNEKPSILLPGGIRVEEKDLIVGINEDARQKALEKDDELRYQNSWLADYYRSLGKKVVLDDEMEDEMEEYEEIE